MYRDFFENANDACAVFTPDGVILAVNRGAERLLGWSREELIGQHVRKVATPETVTLAEERSRRFLAGDKPPSSLFEAELIRNDGTTVRVEARTRAIRDAAGAVIRYQGIYRDLTERLQMQEELRASRERYQLLFDACPDLLYVTDTAGCLLQANAEVLRRTGLSEDALREKTFLDFFAGENRDELLEGFATLTRGERVRPIEVPAKSATGEVRTFEIKGMPLMDKEGTVSEILSVARDITARKAAEQAVRESEALRVRITEAMPDIVYLYDLTQPCVRWVNQQLLTILGHPPEKLQGHVGPLFADLVHPDDRQALADRLRDVSGAGPGTPVETECRVRHANGEYRWLRLRETVCTRSPAGAPQELLGTAQDITDRKRIVTLLQDQTLHYADIGPRLKQFRESLDMTQQEFGQHFGDYDQKQISSYERGQVELPLALLLNIRAHGYPLEAILGVGSTRVLDDTIAYLAASHRDQAVARQLADTMLQLLNRNVAGIERILREFDRPPKPVSGSQKTLLAALAALTKTLP
ncbi:MAG: PAS domain S-box protein [Candidatus Binatia bacterium]